MQILFDLSWYRNLYVKHVVLQKKLYCETFFAVHVRVTSLYLFMLHDIVYFLFVFYYIIYFYFIWWIVAGLLAQYINLINQRFEAYMSFLFWIIETCCLVKNKNTQVVFQRFFAKIKILKILKLGTPWSCCTHLLHTSEESYRMYLSTWYSRTPTIYLSICLSFFLSFFLSLPLSILLSVLFLFFQFRVFRSTTRE